MPSFRFEGQRLLYTEYGSGDRVFVLLHDQLLSQRMHEPLAHDLAQRGNRVITLDLLGHGWSDRPNDMWRYSMGQFAEQVVALLDHLGLEQAVVGGTSLGANVTLEFAAHSRAGAGQGAGGGDACAGPRHLRGGRRLHPLLTIFKVAMPLVRLASAHFPQIPRPTLPLMGKIVVDTVGQDHSSSEAILQGLFLGRIAPGPAVRRSFAQKALVIGHAGDGIHPLADAAMLAGEMPNARLVQATSIYEMRFRPERLTNAIADFLDDCWGWSQAGPARRPAEQAAQAASRGIAAGRPPGGHRIGSPPRLSGHAPDGSPVELYTLLPSMGEVEGCLRTSPPGPTSWVGCGTDRMTRGLVARGHPVVAVDNSEEMLALLDAGDPVFGDIATLRLGRRFRPSCWRVASSMSRRPACALLSCGRAAAPRPRRRDGGSAPRPPLGRRAFPGGARRRRHMVEHVSAAVRDTQLAGNLVSGTVVYQGRQAALGASLQVAVAGRHDAGCRAGARGPRAAALA